MAGPVTAQPVLRLDPALDAIIATDAVIETIAQGFQWTEAPVWRKNGAPRLSDSLFAVTPIARTYGGKRFNSPNDLVFHSNGDVYFTDPPFGLRGMNNDPSKELDYNGVFRVSRAGDVTLLARDLDLPNGIAFSPDERTLYVSNADAKKPVWMAYAIRSDGTVDEGRIFFDATALVAAGSRGVPDGMRVDRQGNLFATGPGGVLILSPQGKHLGTIQTGRSTAN